MATKTGTIESIARTGKSIKVDGAWYGAFAKTQLGSAGVGDNVTFTYTSVEKDGTTYNNIKGNVTVDGAPKSAAPAPAAAGGYTPRPAGGVREFPVGPTSPERVIIRQNALSHATRMVMEGKFYNEDSAEHTSQLIVDMAREFEAYVTGDLDKAIAEAAAEGAF